MQIRKLIIAALFVFSLPVAAEFTTVELAYEVKLSDLRIPVSSTELLMFRECADCEPKTVRMTRETRFVVNGKAVELKEFRRRVSHVRNRASETVIVRHHLESDTITVIKVTL